MTRVSKRLKRAIEGGVGSGGVVCALCVGMYAWVCATRGMHI